jgi:phosphoribosylformylglycinamidine synthase I
MTFGVVVFPGSNCDHDAWYAVSHNIGHKAEYIWHDSPSLGSVDAVILPGGFSYGDYLRCGAIAKFSPVMNAVKKFAADGGLVLGVCNGFQILVESGLLPGALLRNQGLKFVCRDVTIGIESVNSAFTSAGSKGQKLRILSRMARDVISPTRKLSMLSKPRIASFSGTSIIRTGPCAISPASAMNAATSPG